MRNSLLKKARTNLPDFEMWLASMGGLDKLIREYGRDLAEVYHWRMEELEELSPDEAYEQVKQWFLEDLGDAYENFKFEHDGLGDRFPVYRSLTMSSIGELNTREFGIYWSWDPNAAEAHWSSSGEDLDEYVFRGEVNALDVDWNLTLFHNLNPSTGESEKEITLKKGAPITITGWVTGKAPYKESDWNKPLPAFKTVTASESAWTVAENLKPGDIVMRPGNVFKVKQVRREGDEVVVMGPPGVVRRYDPKDEVARQKTAASHGLENLKTYLTMPEKSRHEVFASVFYDEWDDYMVSLGEDYSPADAPKDLLTYFYEMNHRIMEYESPELCPAFMYLSYKRMMRNGWIAHFTNSPGSIVEQGFKNGVSEINDLGLTTLNEGADRSGNGYNFGFPMDKPSYVEELDRKWKLAWDGYGHGLVFARVNAVIAYHSTDAHDQAIFVGAEAKDITEVKRLEDGWEILGQQVPSLAEALKVVQSAVASKKKASTGGLKWGTSNTRVIRLEDMAKDFDDYITLISQLAEDPKSTGAKQPLEVDYKKAVPVKYIATDTAMGQVKTWGMAGEDGDDRGEPHIKEIMNSMKRGVGLPPAIVVSGKVVDGRHRIHAASRLGYPQIPYIDLNEVLVKPKSASFQDGTKFTDKILVVVHPGSCCGSADDQYGRRSLAELYREGIQHELESWDGGVIVIDGELSDELPQYPDFSSAITSALSKAKSAGYISVRRKGEDPDQVRVIEEMVEELQIPNTTSFEVTGAWAYTDGDGCASSVTQALTGMGYKAKTSANAMTGEDSFLSKRATAIPGINFSTSGGKDSFWASAENEEGQEVGAIRCVKFNPEDPHAVEDPWEVYAQDEGEWGTSVPGQDWAVFDAKVEGEWRGKGLGQAMYDLVVAEAKRRGAKYLWSDEMLSGDGKAAWDRLAKRYPVERGPHDRMRMKLANTKQASPDFGYSQYNDREKDLKRVKFDVDLDQVHEFTIHAMYDMVEVGMIQAQETDEGGGEFGFMVHLIDIADDWRGTGLGQLLYDKAIQEARSQGAIKFSSDDHLSTDGIKAWKRLSQRYKVEKVKDGASVAANDDGTMGDAYYIDLKPKGKTAAKQIEGADIVATKDRFAIYLAKTPEALKELSKGTSWFSDTGAELHFEDGGGPLYIFYVDGLPYAILNEYAELRDKRNKDMTADLAEYSVVKPEHEFMAGFVGVMRRLPGVSGFSDIITFPEALQMFGNSFKLNWLMEELDFTDLLTYADDILATKNVEAIVYVMKQMVSPWPEAEEFMEAKPVRFNDRELMEPLTTYCVKAKKARWEAFEPYLMKFGFYPSWREYSKLGFDIEAARTLEDWREWDYEEFIEAFELGIKENKIDNNLIKYMRSDWDEVQRKFNRWDEPLRSKFVKMWKAYCAHFGLKLTE